MLVTTLFKRPVLLWLSVIWLMVSFLSGCEDSSQQRVSFEQPYSQLLVYPDKNDIPGFTLSSAQGSEFSNEQLLGRWTLLFSGFTSCADVCPTTLTELTQLYKELPQELKPNFQIIFLSVDPARDSLPRIKDYLAYFHDDFVGITGDKDQIDTLIGALGGIYIINAEDPEFYTVDHSARIFIIDPQGRRFGMIIGSAMKAKDQSVLIKELTDMTTSVR